MSGVIFEGDTIKRFGERFPRPFIEKITILPDFKMDVIVSVFFQVPTSDEDVEQFKADLNTSGLVIFGRAIDQEEFDGIKQNADETLLRNFYALNSESGSSKGWAADGDFEIVSDEIYNSKGDRFMKYNTTYNTTYTPSTSTKFVTFSSFSSDLSPNTDADTIFYKTQTSDLVYEDVFKEDGTLDIGLVEVYEQQNGNFYYQTPLMSLNRSYHTTDNFGHKNLIDAVNNINQKYSIEEADNISYVLSENSENPKLLISLLETINKFTNKFSPAAGKFYGEISSYLVVADALIMNGEGLTKKLITNTKITDLRVATDHLIVSENQGTSELTADSPDSLFFAEPSVHQMLVPFSSQGDANPNSTAKLLEDINSDNIHDYFVLETQAYFLFDYEKALNYTSKISEILNPLVLLQIYGTDSLANFYEIEEAVASIYYSTAVHRRATPRRTEYTFTPPAASSQFQFESQKNIFPSQCKSEDNSDRTILSKDGHLGKIATKGGGRQSIHFSDPQTAIFSKLQQRAFLARPTHPHYRVACYEMFSYESIEDGVMPATIRFEVKIKDTTMQFYETHVRQKIQDLLAEFRRYLDYANQFCSYNQTDGLFNDFFIKAVKQEFAEPYIWVEAPLYHLLFENMINAEAEGRQKILNIEAIKSAARQGSKDLSPETGNIERVGEFYNTLYAFYNTHLVKGIGLDGSNDIYKVAMSFDYRLKNPEVENTFIMTKKSLSPDDIIDEVEVVAQSEVNDDAALAIATAADDALVQSLTGVNEAVNSAIPAVETVMGAAYNDEYISVWDHFHAHPDQETFNSVIAAARGIRSAVLQEKEYLESIPDPWDNDPYAVVVATLDQYAEAIRDAIQSSI